MLTDQDLIPVSEAAASLGISERRLIGFMARQSLYDPIGGDTSNIGAVDQATERVSHNDQFHQCAD